MKKKMDTAFNIESEHGGVICADDNQCDCIIIKDLQNQSVMEFYDDIFDYDFDKTEYVKLDESMIGQINALMQNIPIVGLEKASSGMYRVIFDKGLGVLQKAANNPGMFRANVVKAGTNNKILATALLAKGSTITNVFANAFAIVSFVTGQYYMKQINSRLSNIEKGIDSIKEWLEQDKRAKIEADMQILNQIGNDIGIKYDDSIWKSSNLIEVQRIKRDALANIRFFKAQIDKVILMFNPKKDKESVVKNNIGKIDTSVKLYQACLLMYGKAICLEAILGADGEIDYIRNKEKEFEAEASLYNKYVRDIGNKITSYTDNCKGLNMSFYNLLDDAGSGNVPKFNYATGNNIASTISNLGQIAVMGVNLAGKAGRKLLNGKNEIYKNDKKMNLDNLEELSISEVGAIERCLKLQEVINSKQLEVIKTREGMYIKRIKVLDEFEVSGNT